jgi:hypothetical protein
MLICLARARREHSGPGPTVSFVFHGADGRRSRRLGLRAWFVDEYVVVGQPDIGGRARFVLRRGPEGTPVARCQRYVPNYVSDPIASAPRSFRLALQRTRK